MVNIYYLKLDDFTFDNSYEKLLSDVRKEKLKKITNEDFKKQSLACELVLQYGFKEYGFDIPKQYSYLPGGKPVCDDAYFSISHTVGAVIVAISNNPVGVDLENKRVIEPSVARKVLTTDELAFYKNHETNEYLLDSFVRKESFFKMTGEGIGLNLTKESVDDILNTSKQVALCFDNYLSIITTKQKDLYDVTKVNVKDLKEMALEVKDE